MAKEKKTIDYKELDAFGIFDCLDDLGVSEETKKKYADEIYPSNKKDDTRVETKKTKKMFYEEFKDVIDFVHPPEKKDSKRKTKKDLLLERLAQYKKIDLGNEEDE